MFIMHELLSLSCSVLFVWYHRSGGFGCSWSNYIAGLWNCVDESKQG